ncbi:hypothetical protein FOMPIDRAFT_1025745 [Fomitopsis schrenkii]|uniref:Uncharacterized protein n=1 Tax=Fomitopsis schrenkii TaxID=2126942 RepID=S8FAD1_FOMSC|nr:hypothetical protein FOMPIDRAFT_1025745 [Fomitopsis schrenkii]
MRRDSMLPFVLLAVAAAPSLALPVAQSTRELATDVYERDVADDVNLYARDDGALDLFERSEYEARDDEGLTELLARAVDEVLSARSGNGFGHGYQAFISGQHEQQVPTHHDVEHAPARHHTPPPSYTPKRPDSPPCPELGSAASTDWVVDLD